MPITESVGIRQIWLLTAIRRRGTGDRHVRQWNSHGRQPGQDGLAHYTRTNCTTKKADVASSHKMGTCFLCFSTRFSCAFSDMKHRLLLKDIPPQTTITPLLTFFGARQTVTCWHAELGHVQSWYCRNQKAQNSPSLRVARLNCSIAFFDLKPDAAHADASCVTTTGFLICRLSCSTDHRKPLPGMFNQAPLLQGQPLPPVVEQMNE